MYDYLSGSTPLIVTTHLGERTKHRKLKDIERSKNIEYDQIENF
jgi:hypothetical protein